MRDLSCLREGSVQIAYAASSASSSSAGGGKVAAHNKLVSCLYQAQLPGGRRCVISVTWTKGLVGQGFSVAVDDASGRRLCKADVRPWLFSKKKGSKSLDVAGDDGKVEISWDLSTARFGPGPEPLGAFYVAVVFDQVMLLLLGDMEKDAYRRMRSAVRPVLGTLFMARKEHIHGKKVYSVKAQLSNNGECHDIVIECDTAGLEDPCLDIRINEMPVVQVKRLAWKFRGNQTILVDGLPVEVFWDVHDWLFGSTMSNAVFMFQTHQEHENSMPWFQLQGLGFSLILYAWKVE